MYDISQWKHVFKLDPTKELSDEHLEMICESGTDAVIVGGSADVAIDDVLHMLVSIRRYMVPCVLEVSTAETMTPGFDFYYIPSVLNSNKAEYITGLQYDVMKEFGDIMNWDEIFMQGSCVLTPDSSVEESCNLLEGDIIAYARMADRLMQFPIFSLEGASENAELIKKVKEELQQAMLHCTVINKQQAQAIAEYADTVVVSDLVYNDIKAALQTVKAVKGA
ncbi:heptaprenylglyceryl phosphate synthase [Bacillus manliponensis]|uniref:Heptaprenylglyceryl phosphate synthase n=1 Tax=Bacillus manliponensis TaxID=574376 RepID=A0A073JW11_9BACI|nr:heptaprenylglyceryl phosphate synthase [Bacillus manliponensis]KEK19219.1 heptaprenylglyceryl phosphate synthase [Bacillus manliponensis]